MVVTVGIVGFPADKKIVLSNLLHQYAVTISESEETDVVISADNATARKPRITISPIGVDTIPTVNDDQVIVLPSSLIETCSAKLEKILDPRISASYRIMTGLPFQYNLVPSSIRSRFLKTKKFDTDLSRHLGIEVARKSIIDAFRSLGFPLERKVPPSLLVTHDIDTEKGFHNSLSLKAVDDEVGVSSLWFLPSDEYPMSKEIAKQLARGSMIGSHDTKHDGKLLSMRKQGALLARLKKSKTTLQNLFEREITYFRSPLLQFSRRIAAALGEAGYTADFSVPCWEPMHPSTMTGSGIESAQPFRVENITEFPLTLFQDHQVLDVMGLSTVEAVKFWTEQARLIRKFDGDLILSVHPDYMFSRDLESYRDLLKSLKEIQTGGPV